LIADQVKETVEDLAQEKFERMVAHQEAQLKATRLAQLEAGRIAHLEAERHARERYHQLHAMPQPAPAHPPSFPRHAYVAAAPPQPVHYAYSPY
jgi:hypothetical protein